MAMIDFPFLQGQGSQATPTSPCFLELIPRLQGWIERRREIFFLRQLSLFQLYIGHWRTSLASILFYLMYRIELCHNHYLMFIVWQGQLFHVVKIDFRRNFSFLSFTLSKKLASFVAVAIEFSFVFFQEETFSSIWYFVLCHLWFLRSLSVIPGTQAGVSEELFFAEKESQSSILPRFFSSLLPSLTEFQEMIREVRYVYLGNKGREREICFQERKQASSEWKPSQFLSQIGQ